LAASTIDENLIDSLSATDQAGLSVASIREKSRHPTGTGDALLQIGGNRLPTSSAAALHSFGKDPGTKSLKNAPRTTRQPKGHALVGDETDIEYKSRQSILVIERQLLPFIIGRRPAVENRPPHRCRWIACFDSCKRSLAISSECPKRRSLLGLELRKSLLADCGQLRCSFLLAAKPSKSSGAKSGKLRRPPGHASGFELRSCLGKTVCGATGPAPDQVEAGPQLRVMDDPAPVPSLSILA
jgi:hypothetical protein